MGGLQAELPACPGFHEGDDPASSFRRRAEFVEQNGLADPSEPGEDHPALGPARLQPVEQHAEPRPLKIAAGQLRGPLARAGGVGVLH